MSFCYTFHWWHIPVGLCLAYLGAGILTMAIGAAMFRRS